MGNEHKIIVGSTDEEGHVEDAGVDSKTMLK
jgi:hypothetical protein